MRKTKTHSGAKKGLRLQETIKYCLEDQEQGIYYLKKVQKEKDI